MQTIKVRINEDRNGCVTITQLDDMIISDENGDPFTLSGKTIFIQGSQQIVDFINFHPEVLYESWHGEFEVNDGYEFEMHEEEFLCCAGIDY